MKNLTYIFIIIFFVYNNSPGQGYYEIERYKKQEESVKKEKEYVYKQKIKSKKVFDRDLLSSKYIYDERGNNIEHIRYFENSDSQIFLYKFDDSDKLIEKYYYGVYTGWPTKVEYLYNKEGKKIRETEFDPRLKMSQIKELAL